MNLIMMGRMKNLKITLNSNWLNTNINTNTNINDDINTNTNINDGIGPEVFEM